MVPFIWMWGFFTLNYLMFSSFFKGAIPLCTVNYLLYYAVITQHTLLKFHFTTHVHFYKVKLQQFIYNV